MIILKSGFLSPRGIARGRRGPWRPAAGAIKRAGPDNLPGPQRLTLLTGREATTKKPPALHDALAVQISIAGHVVFASQLCRNDEDVVGEHRDDRSVVVSTWVAPCRVRFWLIAAVKRMCAANLYLVGVCLNRIGTVFSRLQRRSAPRIDAAGRLIPPGPFCLRDRAPWRGGQRSIAATCFGHGLF